MWTATATLMSRTMHFQTEETPNPDSLKFFLGTQLLPDSQTYDFPSKESAICSPLAMRIFEVEGVKSAFFSSTYIAINKDGDFDWEFLKPEIYAAVADFFSSGEAIFSRPPDAPRRSSENGDDDDEIVQSIKELIEVKIRPMVQEDGGDVEFRKFEDGVVFVKMQGACSGCPSAPATLKRGIERMLMHWVPEVQGVTAIEDDEELDAFNQSEFEKMDRLIQEGDDANDESKEGYLNKK